MTNYIKIFLLLVGLSTYGQEKLTLIDTEILVDRLDSIAQTKNYQEIIELIDQVNPNDSVFWPLQINKSYYLIAQEKYSKSLEISRLGLRYDDRTLNKSFYVNTAAALHQLDSTETSLKVLDSAIKEYPANYELFYNKGVFFEELGRYDEALEAYKTSASLNPFNHDVHLKLGNLCLRQRMTTRALMCFNTYLLLNPDGSQSFNVLNSLNNIVGQDNETQFIKGFNIPGSEIYDEIDLILDNRIAMDDAYETGNELNIALIKQNHIMLESLSSVEITEEYWSQTYLKLFEWIREKGYFNQFSYTVAYSIQNEKYKKIVEKHADDVIAFYQEMKQQMRLIYQDYPVVLTDMPEGVKPYYADNVLDGIGPYDGPEKVGSWRFYEKNGTLKMTGQYNQSSERTGVWTVYYPKGQIKQIGTYENGQLNGENKSFYENGRLKYSVNYKNDTIDGTYQFFRESGALKESIQIEQGERQGLTKTFHEVGDLCVDLIVNYESGEAQGRVTQFSPSGQPIYEVEYLDNKKIGLERTFYRDGTIQLTQNFEQGVEHGPRVEYYGNGNLKAKSAYVEGELQGDSWSYYPDNSIKEKYNYLNGNIDGEFSSYYPSGDLHYKYNFRKGELIAYKFFDSDKNILNEGSKKGGQFKYEGYSVLEQVDARGNYSVEGGKVGKWEFFSVNGSLSSVEYYDNDAATGQTISYYDDGQVKEISNYSEGILDGYHVSYHNNGQMESQGYYRDGEIHKEWRTYQKDGTVSSVQYYHKGKEHGNQLYYSVEGKLVKKMLYEYGKLLKEEFFNEMTETIGLIDYQKMAKDEIVQFQYPSGQLRASYAFLNAKRHGESIEYDATGAKLNEGQYLNGEMHGTWKYYGPNGKLRMEATLNNGKLHGSYNSYYPNGNLEDQYQYHLGQLEGTTLNYAEDGITINGSTEYLNGENHGKRIFRDSNGNIQLIRHYNHGILLGYSYLGTDGEEVPMIPLENESGKVIAYYQNGQLSREMDYQNGYLVGPYKTYFLNGNLYREHFNLNDDYHGVEKIYFESGKIKEENSYSYGDLHGESKKYYENGQVKEIANYLNDEKTGENTFFDSEGTLLRMDTYFNGLRIKSISYASSSK